MQRTIFTLPAHHISVDQNQAVFRHKWQGAEVYWIVPNIYLVSFRHAPNGMMTIKISQDYFTRPTQELCAA